MSENGVPSNLIFLVFFAESCGWCGSNGCVDEHPKCKDWSKDGMCVINPLLIVFSVNDIDLKILIMSSFLLMENQEIFFCGATMING